MNVKLGDGNVTARLSLALTLETQDNTSNNRVEPLSGEVFLNQVEFDAAAALADFFRTAAAWSSDSC